MTTDQPPLLILLPWCVFALAAALKAWQLMRWLRRPSFANTERFRAALERRWAQDGRTP